MRCAAWFRGCLPTRSVLRTRAISTACWNTPQYSRPAVWHGRAVPEILLSGNHEKVRQWRRKQALRRTRARRPDMYAQLDLSSKQDKKLLKEMEAEDREQAGNSENMGAGE